MMLSMSATQVHVKRRVKDSNTSPSEKGLNRNLTTDPFKPRFAQRQRYAYNSSPNMAKSQA